MEGALEDEAVSGKFLNVIINDRQDVKINRSLQLSKMDYQEKQWIKEIIQLPGVVSGDKLDIT